MMSESAVTRRFWICGQVALLLGVGLTVPAVLPVAAQVDPAVELRRSLDSQAEPARPTRQLVVNVRDVMSVVLEEGDELRINVLGDPILTMDQAPINKGGAILHPVLRELRVAGKTLKEAQEMIHDILAADYLVDPSVTLTIVRYANYEFSVMDEVMRPGTYSLTRDKMIDISQAIAMAGGPTRVGSSKVLVERLENGQRKTLKVDISKPNDVIVQPDDRIKVGEKFW
jgi:protein involved in polysaccharide export with SLBB domain